MILRSKTVKIKKCESADGAVTRLRGARNLSVFPALLRCVGCPFMLESKLFDMRQPSHGGLWEIFEVLNGRVVSLGGLILSGLTIEEARGALDVLHNRILSPDTMPAAN